VGSTSKVVPALIAESWLRERQRSVKNYQILKQVLSAQTCVEDVHCNSYPNACNATATRQPGLAQLTAPLVQHHCQWHCRVMQRRRHAIQCSRPAQIM
jgi:hypothetical protein